MADKGTTSAAVPGPGVGHPLIEEHDLLLAVSYRPVAECSGLREMPDEVIAALLHRQEAGFVPDGQQGVSAQLSPACQRISGDFPGSLDGGQVQAELCAPRCGPRDQQFGRGLQRNTQYQQDRESPTTSCGTSSVNFRVTNGSRCDAS